MQVDVKPCLQTSINVNSPTIIAQKDPDATQLGQIAIKQGRKQFRDKSNNIGLITGQIQVKDINYNKKHTSSQQKTQYQQNSYNQTEKQEHHNCDRYMVKNLDSINQNSNRGQYRLSNNSQLKNQNQYQKIFSPQTQSAHYQQHDSNFELCCAECKNVGKACNNWCLSCCAEQTTEQRACQQGNNNNNTSINISFQSGSQFQPTSRQLITQEQKDVPPMYEYHCSCNCDAQNDSCINCMQECQNLCTGCCIVEQHNVQPISDNQVFNKQSQQNEMYLSGRMVSNSSNQLQYNQPSIGNTITQHQYNENRINE